MLLAVVLIIVGFALLIFGANWLVSGASSLAKKFNISDLAIGLTIVAFGTSAPELVVNSFASAENHPDIVFGNVIGSNNFNLFIILGIVGLIMPIKVQSSTVWKEIPISLFAAVLVLLMCFNFFIGEGMTLTRLDGMVLLFLFAGFLYYVYRQMKSSKTLETEMDPIPNASNLKITFLIIIGLIGLVYGGSLVVDNAIFIAQDMGISEKTIGLTVIAAGTSLPELVTSIVAAMKNKSDIAIGNVVGSNIFNLLLVLSTSAIINPLTYNTNFNTDMAMLIGGSILLFVFMFIGKKFLIDRWQAAMLLLIYLGYTTFQVTQ